MDTYGIDHVKIDVHRPKEQRIKDYLDHAETPYLYEVDGIKVKVSFTDTNRTLQECVTRLIRNELKA